MSDATIRSFAPAPLRAERQDEDDPSSRDTLIGRITAAIGVGGRGGHGSGQGASEADLELLTRVRRFPSLRVEDVMVPRADIIAVEENVSFDELLKLFADAQHSRLPVYRENLDDPIGMVHVKDLVCELAQELEGELLPGGESRRSAGVASRIRKDILIVPPSMGVQTLLVQMQTSRMHMALVVDEYGGVDGLVTLEDLVEPIVGDIEDEHDIDEGPEITSHREGGWVAVARMEIADFREATGLDLSLPDSDDVDTLGGLVFTLLGRIPPRGEVVRHPAGPELHVIEVDARRIRKLRILQRKPGAAGPSGSDAQTGGQS